MMTPTTRKLIWAVALLHVVFCIVEIFLWETLTPVVELYDPVLARQADSKTAALTTTLGRNCGVYNGILAGALVWLLTRKDLSPGAERSLATYLLTCIVIAGLFGGIMIKPSILLVQFLPAVVTLINLWRTSNRGSGVSGS